MLSIEQPRTHSFIDTEGGKEGRLLTTEPIMVSWSPYDNEGEFYYAIALEDQRGIPLIFIINAYRTETVDDPGVYFYNNFNGFLEEGLYRAILYSQHEFYAPKEIKGTSEKYLISRGFEKVVDLTFLVNELFSSVVASLTKSPKKTTKAPKKTPAKKGPEPYPKKATKTTQTQKKQPLSFAQKWEAGLIDLPEDPQPPLNRPGYDRSRQPLSFAQKWAAGYIDLPDEEKKPQKGKKKAPPKKKTPRAVSRSPSPSRGRPSEPVEMTDDNPLPTDSFVDLWSFL